MLMTESWLKQAVPGGYRRATLNIFGTSALLMNRADEDRQSKLYKSFTALAGQSRRTPELDAQLSRLEWQLRLYWDEALGPCIPTRNLKENLREAATKWKLGEDIKRSLIFMEPVAPLIYDGPRDMDGLWDGRYCYTTMAQNAGMNGGRVPRTRPMFKHWALRAELVFDPDEVNSDKLLLAAERAQRYGLGDYRPFFGSFRSNLILGDAVRGDIDIAAAQKRDAEEERANREFVERLMNGGRPRRAKLLEPKKLQKQ